MGKIRWSLNPQTPKLTSGHWQQQPDSGWSHQISARTRTKYGSTVSWTNLWPAISGPAVSKTRFSIPRCSELSGTGIPAPKFSRTVSSSEFQWPGFPKARVQWPELWVPGACLQGTELRQPGHPFELFWGPAGPTGKIVTNSSASGETVTDRW